jgi:hypothetical protein
MSIEEIQSKIDAFVEKHPDYEEDSSKRNYVTALINDKISLRNKQGKPRPTL